MGKSFGMKKEENEIRQIKTITHQFKFKFWIFSLFVCIFFFIIFINKTDPFYYEKIEKAKKITIRRKCVIIWIIKKKTTVRMGNCLCLITKNVGLDETTILKKKYKHAHFKYKK